MAKVVPPKRSFLDDCEYLGFVHGDKRWRSHTGERLYAWNSLHGEIEVFNMRERHLGVLDPLGQEIKPAVKGRRIDV